MNVLSLFDGMSCGQIALNRLGIKYDNYYASEIDKYAIKVTKANHPNTIHLGDVRTIDLNDLPQIDLLIGGSPCQSFSFAGKRKGMTTKSEIEILSLDQYIELKNQGFEFEGQSYLFWEYMRVLKSVKPKYFLLENVVMSKKWEKILNKAIGIKPIKINSALVSAQNRTRLYWTNIGLVKSGFFGDVSPGIKQPKDKKIILDQVLQQNVDDHFFLKKVNTKYKSQSNKFHLGDKFQCLTAGTHGYSNGYVIHSTYGRTGNPDQGGVGPLKRFDGKTYCLDCSVGSIVEILNNDKTRFRRLTPIECERLQTVPDNYTNHVSNTQRYKMLGNGWTIDIICHILKHIDL